MPHLSDDQIASAARAYLERALRFAVDGEVLRNAGTVTVLTDEGAEPARSIQQMGDGSSVSERGKLAEQLANARAHLVDGHQQWGSQHIASEIARSQGIVFDELERESQEALLRAMQRATVEEYRIRLAMLNGDYANAVARDPMFAGLRYSLMGHADDSEGARYRDAGARVDLLAANLQRVRFDVDLSHLVHTKAKC